MGTFPRNRPCTWSCAFVVDIAKFHVVGVQKIVVVTEFLLLIHQIATFFSSLCLEGIFDDPKLVADVKEAVATIKKAHGYEVLCCDSLGVEAMDGAQAMVQIGELSANSSGVWKKTRENRQLETWWVAFTEANMTPLAINQMTRWVNTKENFRMNILEGVIRGILQCYFFKSNLLLLVVEVFLTQEEHAGKIVSLM